MCLSFTVFFSSAEVHPELEEIEEAMSKVSLRNRRTRCRVLLESLACYPSKSVQTQNTTELSHLLSVPGVAPETTVLKRLVEFVTYGKRWDTSRREIVEDKEKRQHFLDMAENNMDDVAEALKLGLSFEVVLPFKMSVAFVTKTWEEFRSACLLAVALSAVRNLQFVPALYTEGNTVIIGHSAKWKPRIRDMNIFQAERTLSVEILREILDNIRKKSTVIC